MNLSDYKNEDAIDLIADLIVPITTILGDSDMRSAVAEDAPKAELIKIALKAHKKEVIEILARIQGIEPSEYKGTPVTMSFQILELLNDEEVQKLFLSEQQTEDLIPLMSATENTEEVES